MTWQHFLRTLAVALLGLAALALASQARAEGGDGSTLVSPQQAEEFLEALGEGGKPGAIAEAATGDEATVEQTAAISPKVETRAQASDAVRASALKPLIAQYASENGVPYELADAVVRIESRYNPGARNGPHLGLTQINVRTAQSLGYQGAASGLLDAETNLRYGLKYLAQAYRLAGGDICGAILRYQFGHRTKTMTSASRAYCAKVKVITASAD